MIGDTDQHFKRNDKQHSQPSMPSKQIKLTLTTHQMWWKCKKYYKNTTKTLLSTVKSNTFVNKYWPNSWFKSFKLHSFVVEVSLAVKTFSNVYLFNLLLLEYCNKYYYYFSETLYNKYTIMATIHLALWVKSIENILKLKSVLLLIAWTNSQMLVIVPDTQHTITYRILTKLLKNKNIYCFW